MSLLLAAGLSALARGGVEVSCALPQARPEDVVECVADRAGFSLVFEGRFGDVERRDYAFSAETASSVLTRFAAEWKVSYRVDRPERLTVVAPIPVRGKPLPLVVERMRSPDPIAADASGLAEAAEGAFERILDRARGYEFATTMDGLLRNEIARGSVPPWSSLRLGSPPVGVSDPDGTRRYLVLYVSPLLGPGLPTTDFAIYENRESGYEKVFEDRTGKGQPSRQVRWIAPNAPGESPGWLYFVTRPSRDDELETLALRYASPGEAVREIWSAEAKGSSILGGTSTREAFELVLQESGTWTLRYLTFDLDGAATKLRVEKFADPKRWLDDWLLPPLWDFDAKGKEADPQTEAEKSLRERFSSGPPKEIRCRADATGPRHYRCDLPPYGSVTLRIDFSGEEAGYRMDITTPPDPRSRP